MQITMCVVLVFSMCHFSEVLTTFFSINYVLLHTNKTAFVLQKMILIAFGQLRHRLNHVSTDLDAFKVVISTWKRRNI